MAYRPLDSALHTISKTPRTPFAELVDGELTLNGENSLREALKVSLRQLEATDFSGEDRPFLAEQRAEVNKAKRRLLPQHVKKKKTS